MSYDDYIRAKAATAPATGMPEVPPLGEYLFPFQRDVTAWALRRGRAAMFLDTGLGKTRTQLEFARVASAYLESVGQESRALTLAPLAVTDQTSREGEAIGIRVHYCRAQSAVEPGITITNYDMLHAFDPGAFGVVVCDEASILKSYNGPTRTAIIDFVRRVPFRLLATATPAPNDFDELGSYAQALGIMSLSEMRAMFFTHDGGETQKWRLKGHGKRAFWRWVTSWGVMVKKPSDIGYSDVGYDLPPLEVVDHVVPATREQAREQGRLFVEPASTLNEQRAARRSTMSDRVRIAADIVAKESGESWLIWCELNSESDELASAIPRATEVRGNQTPERKAEVLLGFAKGDVRVLVTKPSIAGFGLNFQNCARVIFVGISHSFEQYYQAVRRCWRFGQKRKVICHVITSELEGNVVKNLRRKQSDADRLADELRGYVAAMVRENVRGACVEQTPYEPREPMTVPAWCSKDTRGANAKHDCGPLWTPPLYPGEPIEQAAEQINFQEWIR